MTAFSPFPPEPIETMKAVEQRDGRDNGRADGDSLGDGLGRVADSVQVGKNLSGRLVLLLSHCLAVVAHFADAVCVVGDGPEHVHRDGVPGQRQHADAAHGHPECHECRIRARIDEHAGENRRDDDHRGRDGALVADREALDDVGGMAGGTVAGQALHRIEFRAGVVFGALIEGHSQDDPDQAGPSGPHIESRDAEVGPVGQSGRIMHAVDERKAGLGLRIFGEIVRIEVQVEDAQQDKPDHAEHRADHEPAIDALHGFADRALVAGADAVGADDAGDHADGANQQAGR